ncbi:hypothetical protein R1sor_003613 [Riccia sorocarpa]|uniref:Uncharacterized protein n=1 Tax=Riccia sorocarpa TaxID=122646 RepID=A0ABD3H495_9MARC
MGSQSRRQSTVDSRRTDQLGQSSRRIARANEDRLRLRRQKYAEQQAERRAASSSEPVASGSQQGIRRKVMEMVDKLKSLSGESVEYESKILTRFLQHSTISKALKVGEIMSLKEQRVAKLLLANLATGLQNDADFVNFLKIAVQLLQCHFRHCSNRLKGLPEAFMGFRNPIH